MKHLPANTSSEFVFEYYCRDHKIFCIVCYCLSVYCLSTYHVWPAGLSMKDKRALIIPCLKLLLPLPSSGQVLQSSSSPFEALSLSTRAAKQFLSMSGLGSAVVFLTRPPAHRVFSHCGYWVTSTPKCIVYWWRGVFIIVGLLESLPWIIDCSGTHLRF